MVELMGTSATEGSAPEVSALGSPAALTGAAGSALGAAAGPASAEAAPDSGYDSDLSFATIELSSFAIGTDADDKLSATALVAVAMELLSALVQFDAAGTESALLETSSEVLAAVTVAEFEDRFRCDAELLLRVITDESLTVCAVPTPLVATWPVCAGPELLGTSSECVSVIVDFFLRAGGAADEAVEALSSA